MIVAHLSFASFVRTPTGAAAVGRRAASPLAIFPNDLSIDDIKDGQAQAAAAAMDDIRVAADAIVTQMALLNGPEGEALGLCAGLFADGVAAPSPERAAAAVSSVVALEKASAAARDGAAISAEEARGGLNGDWRLIFTDSEPTLAAGMTGLGGLPFCSSSAVLQRLASGSPSAQCIEVVALPLGAKTAVVLKGEWRVDGDSQGALLSCDYTSAEANGGEMPPGFADNAQQTVATAPTHVGTRLRVERARSGALFVWERQAVPIDDTLRELM